MIGKIHFILLESMNDNSITVILINTWTERLYAMVEWVMADLKTFQSFESLECL